MEAYALGLDQNFIRSKAEFEKMLSHLGRVESQTMDLSKTEVLIESMGREVLRCILEEQIAIRGPGFIGAEVEGSDSVVRSQKRIRAITKATIFGEITIARVIYSAPGQTSLSPREAMLNLAEHKYSHTLEVQLAFEVAKNSFDASKDSVSSRTGVKIHKRQAEEIAQRVAQDFDAFYEQSSHAIPQNSKIVADHLILTTDAKGIVVRHEDLREATKKRAKKALRKLKKRLSKGEKKNAKRMAQVASVYSIDSNPRTPEQIVAGEKPIKPPRPQEKRVWASVASDADIVIKAMFDEAERRDPKRKQSWAILVDGQEHQYGLIHAELDTRKIKACIILDIIHVIEYLWKAAREFNTEADSLTENWVQHYLLMILNGQAGQAAAGMRRSATRKKLESRDDIETCAGYLHKNADLMRYDEFLAMGLPIATGVIEGACRHLVKDRMDITGARWSLNGAEAVLKLRSIYASGDWEDYCSFHEAREYERNHKIHYAYPERLEQTKLELVK
jgi:hypothetical protein